MDNIYNSISMAFACIDNHQSLSMGLNGSSSTHWIWSTFHTDNTKEKDWKISWQVRDTERVDWHYLLEKIVTPNPIIDIETSILTWFSLFPDLNRPYKYQISQICEKNAKVLPELLFFCNATASI